jgi:hypothetical protein
LAALRAQIAIKGVRLSRTLLLVSNPHRVYPPAASKFMQDVLAMDTQSDGTVRPRASAPPILFAQEGSRAPWA